MTYEEAVDFIKSTKKFGSRPGLENISGLCKILDNPQDTYKCIHVAGTNGKGSTCSMIASILRCAGYKTGLFISPYLDSYLDSIRINGEAISKDLFAYAVSLVKDKLDGMPQGIDNATEFEILTAAAFLVFRKAGCDIVVLEVGLGGRLDATNVIENPLACVITSISLDHTEILGDTIEKIAYEKCGIIKSGGIVVSYPNQDKAAMKVIEKSALSKNNLFFVPDTKSISAETRNLRGTEVAYRGFSLFIPLAGKHQIFNAVTAVETVCTIREHRDISIKDEDIVNGIRNTFLFARQEILYDKPYIILDGAHNPDGILTLADTIKNNFSKKRVAIIMGMLRDKDFETSVSLIAGQSTMFIAITPENRRALENTDLAKIARKYTSNVAVYDDYMEALKAAAAHCGEDGAIVICGSLYSAGKMRKKILELILDLKVLQ